MTEEDRELEQIVRELTRDEKTPAAKKHYRARTGEWVPPPLVPDFDRRDLALDAIRWWSTSRVTGDIGPLPVLNDEEEGK